MTAAVADRDRCLVTVCRGCCCGDTGKHPGVDHDRLLEDLRARLGRAGVVRVAGCLLVCGESNALVVSPTTAERRRGARPVWLGGILEPGLNEAVAAWVRAGGPGAAGLPEGLRPRLIRPFRRQPEGDSTCWTGVSTPSAEVAT